MINIAALPSILGSSVWGLKWALVGENDRQLSCLLVCLHLCCSPTVFCRPAICVQLDQEIQYSIYRECLLVYRTGRWKIGWLIEWLMTGRLDRSQYTKHDIAPTWGDGVRMEEWKMERNGNSNKTAAGEQKSHQALLECGFRLLEIRLRQEIAIWWRCLKWNTKRLGRVSLYFHESPFESRIAMKTTEDFLYDYEHGVTLLNWHMNL